MQSDPGPDNPTMGPGSQRVALITGAAGSLGRAIAHRFASAGFRIALVGRRQPVLDELAAEIEAAESGIATTVVADLAEPGGAARAIAHAHHRFGRVDVLVNSAGGWTGSALGPFAEKSEKDLRTELENNLITTVLACRAAIPHMLDQHYGRIVNISSIAGIIGLEGHAAYSAAKAGHIGLARQLALELGKNSITANCVAPGPVSTAQVRRMLEQGHPGIQAMLEATPTGRLTSAEQIADAVAFFASETSGQINGQFLVIDGGMSST
ncbi:SDR family NAD(P)-dependent oxidoreductase [Pseudonocardia hispaniensis]|uniref:SDR family NAD(P)-dependent oxidoreductase n=1 Tax=Pseudonocardia hispaniensis TaxID=904933 RepID=A0ABW1J3I1_9PSEU